MPKSPNLSLSHGEPDDHQISPWLGHLLLFRPGLFLYVPHCINRQTLIRLRYHPYRVYWETGPSVQPRSSLRLNVRKMHRKLRFLSVYLLVYRIVLLSCSNGKQNCDGTNRPPCCLPVMAYMYVRAHPHLLWCKSRISLGELTCV